MTREYDYIIIGAGCAGLSLLMRIMDNDPGHTKKILLMDKSKKDTNDRTWCFWEKGSGYFEPIVSKQWDRLIFRNKDFSKTLDTGTYQYKMIRAVDFYNYCFERINKAPNIDMVYSTVEEIRFKHGWYTVQTVAKTMEVKTGFLFSAVYRGFPKTKSTFSLLQHFKGWLIETDIPCFDPGQAVFMDFSVPQQWGTVFMYVLPLCPDKALIEYTVFSASALLPGQYDNAIRNYITAQLKISDFRITAIEYGTIPMTSHRFPFYKEGVYYIGTAGGQTKASTGYTFQFIQKQSAQIAGALNKGITDLTGIQPAPSRFRLYDNILLRVLSENKMTGEQIFSTLFKKIPAEKIFRFLDNETTLAEEFPILNAMPPAIFGVAAIKQIFS